MKRATLAILALVLAATWVGTSAADARGRGGCGSHGGPGYRKANGKCASWRD